MPDSQSKSPEELLAEAKALSNLSISQQQEESPRTSGHEVPVTKSEGSLARAIGLVMGAIILAAVSTAGGYFWGKNSVLQETQITSGEALTVQPSASPRDKAAATPSLSPGPAAIGDEVELSGGLTLVLERAWIDSKYSKSKTASPTETQVNVEVTFTNNQLQAMSYTPSQFSLRDSKNLEYKPVSSTSGEYKPLALGSLLPGGSIKGGISFVVPKEEKTFSLLYEDAEVIFSLSTQIQTSDDI